ncbi:DUF6308 family protein [Nesterenkonia suensis]
MSIVEAVTSIRDAQAREWAQTYYGKNGQAAYSGAYFEVLGARESDADRLSAGDLYATMCLSVDVPVAAGIDLLERESARVNELLGRIPSDRELRTVTCSEYAALLGKESAAWKLWHILRATDREEGRWGIGPTRASKLMARKRPHLVPIEDSVVNKVIGFNGNDSWMMWWEALSRSGDELERVAQVVREAVGRTDLSTLRALDVVLWMKGKGF